MEIDNVTQVAFLCACSLSFIMTVIFISQINKRTVHWSFMCAGVIQTLWLFSVGFSETLNLSAHHLVIMEAAQFTGWIFASAQTVQYFCGNCLPKHYKKSVYTLCLSLLGLDTLLAVSGSNVISAQALLIFQGLIYSILALLSIEQLYRNVLTIRSIKLLCLNLAAVFIYDVYFFSQSIVQPELNVGFFQIRAAIIIVTSVFMGMAVIALPQTHDQPARLSLSRPVVFYTTSLTIAGSVLALIALGGYYVRTLGGDWGAMAYTLLLAGAVISLLIVFTSRATRERLTVLINKHLFSHKYDYRTEWLKLIDRLSQPTSSDDVHKQAINAVATIFKSSGGALWMHKGKVLAPVYQTNITVNILECIEPENSAFVQALERSEWVFLPSSTDRNEALSQNNELLPEWATRIDNIWLILPLINESDLIGFMVLTRPANNDSLNWEDLDLLKTVGRQVASYLERHEQAEQLAEARQFDAFNKLAAYVMHDLKNLIAQQSLVVKNAEKHKDNPAFIEDAIQTINNSVSRMNNLLRKLQRNEPEGVRVLNFNEIMLEAIKRCQKAQPQPTLRNEHAEIRVKGDFDSLVMVFVHLIHNAQDATPKSGFIDINITRENDLVFVAIEDNGEGMSPEFIRDRLFKPFDTTKTGKGMGIGVYQARDYIQTLGGNVTVESVPNEGTTFTISVPIVLS